MKSTTKNSKLWGGRFNANTNAAVESFNASIHFDQEMITEDILGSLAHAQMLAHYGIVSQQEHQAIQSGLLTLAHKASKRELNFLESDEDIHMNIERQLQEEIGEPAGKLHTARSRNDQVALDLHLYLRKHTVILVDLLSQLQITLMDIATRHQKTLLPGYTHLQRAQPIYLASHLLAYASMFQRDIERLKEGFQRINQSPLGACALAGSSFDIDRAYTAHLLDFDGIYPNTLDAVSDRDFVVEFLAASSLIMTHFSRLSEELILWASQEFNFICLDDAFCTGSSIMPQKKNPDVAELARGKTGRVYGALITLLTVLKGLPLAYNKDLQEDKEPLFDTLKTLKATLHVYIPMLAHIKFQENNMQAATRSGFINATLLAEYLVKKGIPFRKAHELVGNMVNFCVQKNCQLEALKLTELQSFSSLIESDVYSLLDPQNTTAHQTDPLQKELTLHKKQIAHTLEWIEQKTHRLKAVTSKFNLPDGF